MKTYAYILFLAAIAMTPWTSSTADNGTAARDDIPEFSDAPLDSVIIEGIESGLAAEIRDVILSPRSGILNSGLVEHDVDAAAAYLRERGWWRAKATAAIDTTGGVILRFLLEPGRPFYLGDIEIDGEPEELNTGDLSGVTEDGMFRRAALDSLIGTVTAQSAAAGYPGAIIEPALTARGDTIDVTLAVTPGERAHIDSIAVRGLQRTDERVVRRELAGLAGEPAGLSVTAEAETALRRLTYLRPDGTPVIEYDAAGRGILAVRVSETRQGTFDGVLGYQPGDGGASGEMIGRFNLDMANIFGTGRAALVRWENLGNDSEDLELRYTEPWALGRPWDVTASFLQEERGIQGYTRTGMSLSAARRLGDLRGEIGVQYEKISADSLHSASATGVGLAVDWTALDNRENPSSGFRYGLNWSSLARTWRFGLRSQTRIDRVAIDLDHFIPTFSRQTLAILVRYRNVTIPIDRMAPADRYWLGGASTIRGYAEHLLPAVKAGWATVEYRFLTGEASRVFLFTDVGHLVNRRIDDGSAITNTRTVAGYGFGIRLSTSGGTLGFDYGLSRDDSITGGKVHVSVSTDF